MHEPWNVCIYCDTLASDNNIEYLYTNVHFGQAMSANGKRHYPGYISHWLPASVVPCVGH